MTNPLDPHVLAQSLLNWVPLVLSLTVHEWAHAWSAFKLGDDTAARAGRLTLNPLPHIDLLGTVLLPLFFAPLGVPIGWAKPVPFNPTRFTRKVSMTTGTMITKAAGPISNLVLALASTLVLALLFRFASSVLESAPVLVRLLVMMMTINVVLALFNLLPIHPLDGAGVLEGVLPDRFRGAWARVCRYSPLFLVVIMVMGVGPILGRPINVLMGGLMRLLEAVASG